MVVAVLGQAALLLAALVALSGSAACFVGGRRLMVRNAEQPAIPGARTQQRWADLGMAAPRALFVLVAGATFLLLLAFVARDYTLAYVQGRVSNDLPLGFRLTALWSGQQGSLLLWLLVLASCGVMMLRSLRRAHLSAALVSYATGALLAVASFFAVLVAFVARPFEVVGQLASDGAGMSPSLQNYWMAAHPPTLYLGYVGVTVPFAIVVGALLAKRRDDAWVGALRGWVLFSWVCLSLGLVLGARWAYEEIGWGGYWAWDPVENAALMPWLTSTALLHSIMVQQRRGMMRFWNVVLASATFLLSIFGTFITRSGVLSSVHAFVSSPVGWWFIGALGVAALATITLLFVHRDLLRAEHDVDSVVSREALLLFNNLLLVALMLVVLWGVVFPIMTAAFSTTRISLQEPWYDFFAAAFGLPLTAMLALAPMIAWRGTPWRRVLRSMVIPVGVAAVTGGVLALAGAGSSPMSCAAVSLGTMVLAGVAIDLGRARSRRRIGAWIAHAGFALLIIAIAGSGWSHRVERELQPGERVKVGSYQLRYDHTMRRRTSSTMQTRAVFEVSRGSGSGHSVGSLRAGRDFHPASGEASNEVAVHRDWLHAQDLFVTVDRITEDGTIQVVVLVNQLLPLLWLGGIITIVGALIVAVPDRRRGRAIGPNSTISAVDDANVPIRTGVGG